jgi:flagellar hook-associated protein 2
VLVVVTRLNGFSNSGIDIDAIVKQMMAARRAPLDKLNQTKQILTWQQTDYRAMNTKILDLQTSAFNMKLQSSYMSKTTTSSDDNIISASGTSNASNGVYVMKVDKLATTASMKSTGSVKLATDLSADPTVFEPVPTNTLISALYSNGVTAPQSTALTIGGAKGTATIQVNSSDSIATFLSSFNAQSSVTGVKASYESNLRTFFFTSTTTGATSKVELNFKDSDSLDTAPDSGFLQNALNLGSSTSVTTGERIVGNAVEPFTTTPDPIPDINKLIDNTLVGTQTFRVKYGDKSYDFNINSTTKIGDLIDSINASALKTTDGVTAGLNAATGEFVMMLPTPPKSVVFSDVTGNGTSVLPTLGLSSLNMEGSTVVGAEFKSSGLPYLDSNKVIDSNISAGKTLKITYNTKTYDFSVTGTTTIGSLISQINSSELGTKHGVNASLDKSGQLTFTNPDSNVSQLDFSETLGGANLLGSLGLTVGGNNPSSFSYSKLTNSGQDAEVWYNGVLGKYASNTISVGGINFTAKKVSTDDVNIVVSQDVDAVYDKIKAFVDKYNDVIDTINLKTTEERYRNYLPLTDEQKTAMKDTEIELWEERAKSGLLRNDSLLSGVVGNFRQNWYQNVTGGSSSYQQMSDIGIATQGYVENGKLYINEVKLKEAIANDPEGVMRLFTANDNNTATTSGDGIAVRLYDSAANVLSNLKNKAGTAGSISSTYEIGKKLTSLNTNISSLLARLDDYEAQYYKQFTAMEQALSKYQAQASTLFGTS